MKINNEKQWFDFPEFMNLSNYQITTNGELRNKFTKNIINQEQLFDNEFLYVTLMNNNKKKIVLKFIY
jgi:hypothetical protein